MERSDIDSEEQYGVITVKMYERKYGDWVKYEDAESLKDELSWSTKRISELEDELLDSEKEVERLTEMLELLGGDE